MLFPVGSPAVLPKLPVLAPNVPAVSAPAVPAPDTFERGGRRFSISFSERPVSAAANAPVRYALTEAQVGALPESERQVGGQVVSREEMLSALALFRGIEADPKLVGALKSAAGVGNPSYARSGEEWVGAQGLREVARLARERNMPLTREGVAAFKAAHGLTGGNVLGPTTARAMVQTLTGPAESPKLDPKSYDALQATVTSRHGASAWKTGPNQVNLIALRGYSEGRVHDNAFGRYNDTLVVAWQDAQGTKHTKSFRATVDPGVTRGSADGVAHVREGHWTYYRSAYKGGAKRALRSDDVVLVDRDTNRNGKIDAGERNRACRPGQGILVHQGGTGSSVGGYSEGCFAVHGGRPAFEQFWSLMKLDKDGAAGRIGVTLVDP